MYETTTTAPGGICVVEDPGPYARAADAFERHAGTIRRSVLRVVRDADVADDLVSEAFTRLLVEARAGRWPDQVVPWLCRVASNLAMSRGRRLSVAARADRVLQTRHLERAVESPETEVLRREFSLDIDRAVDTLGPDARTAILLAAQGFDGATIAAAIGRSHAATRTLLCRSRGSLRAALSSMEQ
jgi:RNA polymerase sigma-70 factor (ECF subfamily)